MTSGVKSQLPKQTARFTAASRGARPASVQVPSAERKVREILAAADIGVNGCRPWDLQVRDSRFYPRVMEQGTLGGGEAYMDAWWDVEALDEFFARVHLIKPSGNFGKTPFLVALKSKIAPPPERRLKAGEVGREHYEPGVDLYQAMLDKHMQYSCAYWDNCQTLEEAQNKKLHLICRKLNLAPGMRVLELGSGFGGLARFMATEYGCEVIGYNVSRPQIEYARTMCQGLPVRFELKDYREAWKERIDFDRVVSVGLCEHIGHKSYRHFFELALSRLRPTGLLLLHTIGGNVSNQATDPWIDKYILPNGMVPSVAQLGEAMDGLFIVEDWHNFGPDYDKTLMAWWRNFDAAWPRLRTRYDHRFYRMWRFFLLASAGRFRARRLQLWQIVASKGGIPFYKPVR